VVLLISARAQIVLHWKYAICSFSFPGDSHGSRVGCSTLCSFGGGAGGREKKGRHNAESQRTGQKRDGTHGQGKIREQQDEVVRAEDRFKDDNLAVSLEKDRYGDEAGDDPKGAQEIRKPGDAAKAGSSRSSD